MAAERTPGLLKALVSTTPEMRKKSRNEFLGFGVAGTLFSAALATGIVYSADMIASGITNLADNGLHLLPFVPTSFNIPNFMNNGIDQAGSWVNHFQGASVLPHLASEHLSGVSHDQNFWGTIEGLTAVAAAGKGAILAYEAGKRRVKHAKTVMSGRIYDIPVAGPVIQVSDATEGVRKIGELIPKAIEIASLTSGSPYGLNDVFGLASILLGYRPKNGILSVKDLLGMSALLVLPYVPTLTTFDIIKGIHKHGTATVKHAQQLHKKATTGRQ